MTGLTGHQHLGTESEWIREQLEQLVSSLPVAAGLSSLAIGADQVWAEVLVRHRIPLKVIVPSDRYETTFSDRDIGEYHRLLSYASVIQMLPFPQPSEAAFYEAGKTIVDQSSELIAIWNGLPAKGFGGTGDIVRYAQEKSKPLIHINPVERSVTYMR